MSPKYAKDQPAGFTNRIEKVAIVGVRTTLSSYESRKTHPLIFRQRPAEGLAATSPSTS